MRRTRAVVAVLAAALSLGGCGVQQTGVRLAGEAPTGLGTGVTLYFVDDHGELRAQLRETGRLGTVAEAVSLLLIGPQAPGLHTEIADVGVTRVESVPERGAIGLRLPLAPSDVTPKGIDQIVCTATVSERQRGGAQRARVRLLFTIPDSGSGRERTCPLDASAP